MRANTRCRFKRVDMKNPRRTRNAMKLSGDCQPQKSPRSCLNNKLQYSLLNLQPGLASRINQVEVICSTQFEQVCIFSLISAPFLFCGNVVSAELWRHSVV